MIRAFLSSLPVSPAKAFPTVLIVLDLAAAAVYASCGWAEWRKVVYWSAAAALTYVVTY